MTTGFSERIAALSPEQLQGLANRLATKQPAEQRTAPIPAAARPARIPLSHSQEGAWLAERLKVAGATTYTLSVPIKFEGALDVVALERSIVALIVRHESLRTRIESTAEGDGYQVIDAHREFKLDTLDLASLSPPARQSQVERQMAEAAATVFDLARGPLFRARLLRVSEREHVLCWTVHHMIWDGWSIPIFIRDLLAAYFAFTAGQLSQLPELPLQYADYAWSQRQQAQSAANQERLTYWKKRLEAAATLELPTDRPRSKKSGFDNVRWEFSLADDLTVSLRALSRKEGVTLYMLLLATMQVLLSRWAAQADIVVGTPVARRTKQTENLIGFFSSMLPIRVDVANTLTFRELLARVKNACLGAFAHQDVSNERLIEELQLDRQAARNPLFQVTFAVHAFGTPPDLNGLKLTLPQAQYATTGTELSLHLTDVADKLSGWVEYASELFDRATIERFVDQYRALLEAVVKEPQCPIMRLPLLSEQERRRVTVQFNDTLRPYPRDKLIHQLFEERAQFTPHAVALVQEGGSLSYRELNRQSNQLAHYLLKSGVTPGSMVGLCGERSPEMIVAVLGIMKAGGAYVPLDPGYPQQRLHYMLKDTAAAHVILTQENLRAGLPETTAAVIALDACREEIASGADCDIDPASLGLTPDHLAYVMYTSGSTGEPKGVMVPHHAVNRLVINNDYVQVDATDCIAFCSNPAFDASTFEIWAALLNGASLLIVPQAVLLDASALAKLLEERGVTVLHLTTALFNQYSDSLAHIFAGLKRLYFGGEAADPNIARKVLQNSPPRHLIHLYGPTETTSFAAWHRLESVAPDARIPIGKPLGNARVYILDGHRQPVPIGWVGEIYVGGAGVAHGYLNRPQLTAERFLTDPFSTQPNARMYKTGDLARWLPDGTIEFCGRYDNQVKIRGYRVELGEVEAHLSRHPQVKEAVVIAWEEEPGEKRLVGYVVPDTLAAGPADETGPSSLERWQSWFDEAKRFDDAPNFAGWNSVTTGRAIPEAQMQEWLNETIRRIRDLGPQKVLELGCGSGLVVEQLAPHCATYRASDFSGNVIQRLRRWIGTRTNLRHVEVAQEGALDFDAGGGPYDTIVLNSVVQYFPDVEYLIRVVERAADSVCDGGRIFIGDVRNFDLLEAFHSSVQLTKADANLRVVELKRRIGRAMQQEEELVVAPEFFRALPRRLPRIAGVEVQIKRGRADNELTRYRYDVTLHIGQHAQPAPEQWLQLDGGRDDLVAELSQLLQARSAAGIRIGGVENARTAKDLLIVRMLETCDGDVQVGEFRQRLQAAAGSGVDPETLCRLAERHGFRARPSWARDSRDGKMDFELVDPDRCSARVTAEFAGETAQGRAWSSYAHVPAARQRDQEQELASTLGAQLREYLDRKLPEYMVPSVITVLDELPLTPNGKVDRSKLPAPQFGLSRAEPYAAPQGRVEEALAGVWQQVLRVERVGRNDDFAELGGNSILAIQIAGRANRQGLPLEGWQVIEHGSIAKLAAEIGSDASVATAADEPAGEPTFVPGEVPLSPLMRRLVTLLDETFLHNNLLVLRLECGRRLEPGRLTRAIRQLVAHHDALRIRFQPARGEVRLWNAGVEAADDERLVESVDLSSLDQSGQQQAIDELSTKLRTPGDIETIRMLRAVLIERGGNQPQQLLLAVHHAVYDPITREILLDDLSSACEQASRGEEIRLGAKTTSFKRYAEYIRDHAASIAAREEGYWRERLTAQNVALVRSEGAADNFGIKTALDVAQTSALLSSVQGKYNATIEELLLAAFTHAFARETGRRKVVVSLTRSGREALFEGIDVSRTVGWFSSEFPVLLDTTAAPELGGAAVQTIKEQVRAVPNQGMGYGVLRYSGPQDRLAECASSKIGLNYLGNPSARRAQLLSVAAVDLNNFDDYKLADPATGRLQIFADIHAGALRMTWVCDALLLSKSSVQALADDTLQALRDLIAVEGVR
jgi:amino acid adenylation domain-containing protein/non-ribosomal peptide synthase protein (TIGR01720 family)